MVEFVTDTTSPAMQNQTNDWQTRLQAGDPSLHVHLIGIGGAGLSAIAQVLNAERHDRQRK